MRVAAPQVRLRVRNRAKDRMLQLQNGRFILNWLKVEGQAYPRYESIHREFAELLERFRDFLNTGSSGKLPVGNQWEVTYLNHIPKGGIWKSPMDWGFCRLWNADRFTLPHVELESVESEWHFVIPRQQGRLHINWKHARKPKGEELIVLNLTARGACEAPELAMNQCLTGLDQGHTAIVTTFRDIMSETANASWGILNDAKATA